MSKVETFDTVSGTTVIDVAPSTNAIRYDEEVDALTAWFRRRSTMQKVLVTVGAPLALVCITATFAFVGLGQVSDQLQVADAQSIAKASEQAAQLRSAMLVCVGAGIALMLFLFTVIRRDIIGTSRQLIDCMHQISSRKLDIVVPYRDRVDEYGELGDAIESMRLNAIELAQLTEEQEIRASAELEEQARLQLQKEEAREEREKTLRDIADQFEKTVGEVVKGVSTASSELQSTSAEMAASAEQSATRTSDVASSMEDANSGATAAASASDEFAMSIGEISRQAASSAQLARNATESANEADATISALAASAEQVGQIVELIHTIAQRTNLLALNASIEAARGGEAGRGFAVVASEVKELAMQTSRATEQVAEQIRTMQDTTTDSVKALRSISDEVAQLENTAVSIASAVDQQSVAGQDLAQSIDLAARGTEQVSSHIKEVRELSFSTGAAATQVLASSTELEQQAVILRSHVEGFLTKIRAG